MKWQNDDFRRAVDALRASGSVTIAARRCGVSPAAMKDAFRRAGKLNPGSYTKRIVNRKLPGDFVQELETERKAKVSKRTLTYVVVSDVHVPFQDKPANAAICALLKDLRPDGLIVNGDFLDLIEVSTHASGSVAQLEGQRISTTFREGNKLLDSYQEAAGRQCQDNHFIQGNHEFRIDRWMNSGDNAVWLGDDATSIASRLRFKERGFSYHPNYPEGYVKLGHLIVTHGKWCGKYAAAVHLDRYRHSVLIGHVHTPQAFYGSGFEKQQAGFSTGHLADESSPALAYAPKPNAWRKGAAVVHVDPNGSYHVQLVNFVDGSFYFGGKRYGGSK